MHIEFLIEDKSGKVFLERVLPKIIDSQHTYRIHPYKGIGRIPKNMRSNIDPNQRILLDKLPKMLQGYGKTFSSYSEEYRSLIIVICDLDDRNCKNFRCELIDVLNNCYPQPEAYFCIAIEEGEAWLLGDIAAIKAAYPNAKQQVLTNYNNDSICGTWELLANAIYPGGWDLLKNKGWQAIGEEKSKWAENITQHMEVDNNSSPSFQYFRDKIRSLC